MLEPLEDLSCSLELLDLETIWIDSYSIQQIKTNDEVEWVINPELLSAFKINIKDLEEVPTNYKNLRNIRYHDSKGQLHLWKYWQVTTLNQQGLEYLIELSQKRTAILKQFYTQAIAFHAA